jgi:hypothetical protein
VVTLVVSTINIIHVLNSYLVLALIPALTFSMPPNNRFDSRPQLTISNRARRPPNSNNIRSTLHIGPIIPKYGTLILHQSSCPRDRNLHQQPTHWNSVECYSPLLLSDIQTTPLPGVPSRVVTVGVPWQPSVKLVSAANLKLGRPRASVVRAQA